MDAVGIGQDAGLPVEPQRAVLPGLLPEFVADLQIFVGDIVALVVRDDGAEAVGLVHLAGGGHDIPRHPALGDVVEGREEARRMIGRGVRRREGDGETEMARAAGEGGDQDRRIDRRREHAVPQGRRFRFAVDVADAHGIGEKQGVELAPLQDPGELDPVVQGQESFRALVIGKFPGAPELRTRTGQGESVEMNLLRHRSSLQLGLRVRAPIRAPIRARPSPELPAVRILDHRSETRLPFMKPGRRITLPGPPPKTFPSPLEGEGCGGLASLRA